MPDPTPTAQHYVEARAALCLLCEEGVPFTPMYEGDDREHGHDRDGYWLPCEAVKMPRTTERVAAALAAAEARGEAREREACAQIACLWCREGVQHDLNYCAGREFRARASAPPPTTDGGT